MPANLHTCVCFGSRGPRVPSPKPVFRLQNLLPSCTETTPQPRFFSVRLAMSLELYSREAKEGTHRGARFGVKLQLNPVVDVHVGGEDPVPSSSKPNTSKTQVGKCETSRVELFGYVSSVHTRLLHAGKYPTFTFWANSLMGREEETAKWRWDNSSDSLCVHVRCEGHTHAVSTQNTDFPSDAYKNHPHHNFLYTLGWKKADTFRTHPPMMHDTMGVKLRLRLGCEVGRGWVRLRERYEFSIRRRPKRTQQHRRTNDHLARSPRV